MNSAKLVWATPDIDRHLAYMARVSSADQDNPNIEGLLRYMLREGHVSPFEMCSMCVEVVTTRAVARQVLRHGSLKFQEFSQRYQDVSVLNETPLVSECRMQDTTNRQNSLDCEDSELAKWWKEAQIEHGQRTLNLYKEAINSGIAKEVARSILPEGNTASRLYVVGNIRSWIFYLKARLDPSTQKEHRELAQQIHTVFSEVAPVVSKLVFN